MICEKSENLKKTKLRIDKFFNILETCFVRYLVAKHAFRDCLSTKHVQYFKSKKYFFQIIPIKLKKFKINVSKFGTMAFQLKNCAQTSNIFLGLTRFGALYLHNGSRVCEKKQFIVLYSFGYWSTEKKISLSFEHWPHVLAWRHKLPNFFLLSSQISGLLYLFQVGILERGDTLYFVSFTTRWSESIFCTLKLWNRKVLHVLAKSTEKHFHSWSSNIEESLLIYKLNTETSCTF